MTTPPAAVATAHELRLAVGSLVRAINARGAMPAGQVAALGVLDREGPAATSELAVRARMRHQSMASVVQALAQQGLVASRPHPTDGRKRLLSITDAGRALLGDERDRREDRLAAAIEDALTPEEVEALRVATPLIARIADRARAR